MTFHGTRLEEPKHRLVATRSVSCWFGSVSRCRGWPKPMEEVHVRASSSCKGLSLRTARVSFRHLPGA